MLKRWEGSFRDWLNAEPGHVLMSLIELILKFCRLLRNRFKQFKMRLERKEIYLCLKEEKFHFLLDSVSLLL